MEDVAEEEQLVDDVQLTDRTTPDAEAQQLHGSFAPDDADNDDHSQRESAENSDENSDDD